MYFTVEIYKVVVLKSLVHPTHKTREQTKVKAPKVQNRVIHLGAGLLTSAKRIWPLGLGVMGLFTNILGDFDAGGSGSKLCNVSAKSKYGKWLKRGVGSQTIGVTVLALPLPSCVAFGKLSTTLLLHFPYLQNGIMVAMWKHWSICQVLSTASGPWLMLK